MILDPTQEPRDHVLESILRNQDGRAYCACAPTRTTRSEWMQGDQLRLRDPSRRRRGGRGDHRFERILSVISSEIPRGAQCPVLSKIHNTVSLRYGVCARREPETPESDRPLDRRYRNGAYKPTLSYRQPERVPGRDSYFVSVCLAYRPTRAHSGRIHGTRWARVASAREPSVIGDG